MGLIHCQRAARVRDSLLDAVEASRALDQLREQTASSQL
jgi:hypothetical protein